MKKIVAMINIVFKQLLNNYVQEISISVMYNKRINKRKTLKIK